jgi:hypothetical protein
VLLHIEPEKLFIGREFPGFRFWHGAVSGRCETSYLRAGKREELFLTRFARLPSAIAMFIITPCSQI